MGGCSHDYDLVWSKTSQGGSAKPKPQCYKLECGLYKNSECLKKHKPFCAKPTTKHEVRCCSSKKPSGSGWKNPAGKCKVWGSVGGACVHDATYVQAVAKCKKAGGRLCTSQELIDNCASGTGCSHDYDLVWSSTFQGSAPPKPQCYKLECGDYKNSECLKKHKPYCAKPTTKHEVRCCSSKKLGGWKSPSGKCKVWGSVGGT